MDVGVYVHFPWCRRLCPYCDFPVVVAAGEPPHRAYLALVLAELTAQAPRFAGRGLATIYLGGGTPSWWDPACVAELIAAIRATFPGAPTEVTVEANPIDCTPTRMAAWRAAGVTRLSIGVQSWDDAELSALGRDHRMGDGPAAIAGATAAGFGSLSADVILGPPGIEPPPDGAAPASVHAAAASGVDHLSVYELTIEERTAFGKRHRAGRLPVLGDEQLAALFEATHHTLTAAGFEHYEVSSYARPGRRAIHNARYWAGGEFLGLGVGAASFWRDPAGGGARWHNHRALARYQRPDDRIAEHSPCDAAELARDLVWLGMRTSDGVALAAAAPAVVAWATATGLATAADDRLRPTLRGFLFADQLAARITSG
ncbi:MAG: coproporphyrinogen III oxidase family protein [Myxococcales bacterium]|nr:coproporphyrinogen III oxidase family protein [Myxococcales bacterium]